MRKQILFFITAVLMWQPSANASNALAGKWMQSRSQFYYLEILPSNRCVKREGGSIQKYNCKVTADNHIQMGPFVASYQLDGDTLTINYPGNRTLVYTRYAAWIKQHPSRGLEDAIERKDIKSAQAILATMKNIGYTACGKYYGLAYASNDVEAAKAGIKHGCDQMQLASEWLKKDDKRDVLAFLYGNKIFDINAEEHGATILFYAVGAAGSLLEQYRDLVGDVRFLLQFKPDINKKTSQGKDVYGVIPRTMTINVYDDERIKKKKVHANQVIAEIRKLLDDYSGRHTASQSIAKTANSSAVGQPVSKTAKAPQSIMRASATAKNINKPPFKTPAMPAQGGCQSVSPAVPEGFKNLALQGKAMQVSTGNWFGIRADASLAIDGNTDGAYKHKSVAHTNANRKAWWLVNLGDNKTIKSIAIWNRTDPSVGARLHNFSVYVINSSGNIVYKQGYCSGRNFPKPALMISLPASILGQYVKVMLNDPGYLQLAEVQVFGE